MSRPDWVANEVADQVVINVQKLIKAGITSHPDIDKFNELIAGVKAYSVFDLTRQGVIQRIFDTERSKYQASRSNKKSNFSIDMDDVVSTFWENVYKYLDKASVTGGTVDVRVVEGQDVDEDKVEAKGGINVTSRDTKCNPVYYLRKMGVMGVRNLINASYRRNLMQICEECNHASTATRSEVNGKECPKCDSKQVENHWPDGNSAYKVKKQKICKSCKHIWQRKFAYICGKCDSLEVRIEQRHSPTDENTFQIAAEEMSVEEELVQAETEANLEELVEEIYDFLPSDPKDPTLISKTKEIFTILTDPEMAKDICQKCVAKAPLVCSEGCKTSCTHVRIPDPKISCGASTFSIGKCVNFSKKIGEYHSCSASLTARRMKKIRQYFVRYVVINKNREECAPLYQLMKERGILSEYQ